MVTKGCTIFPPWVLYNCNTLDPLVAFPCANKLGRTSNFQVWQDNASQSSSIKGNLLKQMGECWTHGQLLWSWRHCHPYPWFKVIINIVSKESIVYYVTINASNITFALTSQKCHLNLWEREGIGCIVSVFIMCSFFMCKMDYVNDKLIYTST